MSIYHAFNLCVFQCQSVIDCKAVIDYYAEQKQTQIFILLQRKWTVLKEIAYVLSIPYSATISLQKKSLTLSDVFGIWLKMTLHLNACVQKENYQTELASHLLNAINERKKEIENNPMMTCALFLDPRFRNQIVRDENKIQQAKSTLLNIWRRLITLDESKPTEEQNEVINTSNKSGVSFEYDEQVELDKYLANGYATESIVSDESRREEETGDIEHLLDTFDPEPIKSNENIIQFWENNKNKYKEIYKLATVVMAIPPTEVQTERDFSKLNFVFTNRRCRLTEERLEDIMTINLNAEIFYLVKEEEKNAMIAFCSNENS